jgi:hypothetical protein
VVLCNRNHHISRTFISLLYTNISPHSVDCNCYSIYSVILTSSFYFKTPAQFVYYGLKLHLAAFTLFYGRFFQPHWQKQGSHTNCICSGLCQELSWYFSKKITSVLKGYCWCCDRLIIPKLYTSANFCGYYCELGRLSPFTAKPPP